MGVIHQPSSLNLLDTGDIYIDSANEDGELTNCVGGIVYPETGVVLIVNERKKTSASK